MKEIKKYHGNGQICEYYWVNEKGQLEGEYKEWYNNGQIRRHCFFKNNNVDGEYKSWYESGQLIAHYFYHNNEEIDIAEYVQDVNNITECEYFLLQIIFGYFPVIKFNGTEHERN